MNQLKWRRPFKRKTDCCMQSVIEDTTRQFRIIRSSPPGLSPLFYAIRRAAEGWTILLGRHRTKRAALRRCERLNGNDARGIRDGRRRTRTA